jgi:hypothetical protein
MRVNFQLGAGSIELRSSTVKKDTESKALTQAIFKRFDISLLMREGSMSVRTSAIIMRAFLR